MVMKAGTDIWKMTTVSAFRSMLPRLKELGVEYIRLEFGNESLPNLRTLVPEVINNGFKILALLIEKSYAPNNPTGWGDWITSVVNEFKQYVHVWECWNEPNQTTLFFNGGTALQYVSFLKECYTHAKAADPTCMILGGSIAFTHDTAINWLRTIYENTTDRTDHYMDMVAWHPYCNPYRPEGGYSDSHPNNPYEWLTHVKAVMEEYGDTRNIWITELGWQSNTTDAALPMTEQSQSDYTVAALQLAYSWRWVEGYILYSFKDSSSGTRKMGLVTTSLTPKIAFYAVKDFIANYIPYEPTYPCPVCGLVFPTPEALATHMAQAHPAPTFPCPFCDLIFTSENELGTHIRAAHPQLSFPCPFCDLSFGSEVELGTHILAAHPQAKTGCFIATACGTSNMHLATLRRFRDQCLPIPLVNAYYRGSPPLASRIRSHANVKKVFRKVIEWLTFQLKKTLTF